MLESTEPNLDQLIWVNPHGNRGISKSENYPVVSARVNSADTVPNLHALQTELFERRYERISQDHKDFSFVRYHSRHI